MNYPTYKVTATYKGINRVPFFFEGQRYELTIRQMAYASGTRPQVIRANSLDVFVEYASEEALWQDWEKVD